MTDARQTPFISGQMRVSGSKRRMQGRGSEARMHQVPRADQIELADAIAEGSRRRPSQAFGEYFSNQGGSWAPGAPSEGAYALPEEAGSICLQLDGLFGCLENVPPRCPE